MTGKKIAGNITFLLTVALLALSAPESARAGSDVYKPTAGDKWVFTDDLMDKAGTEAWTTVAKVENDMVTLINSSGCTEIRRLSFVYPAETYTNCAGATGTREITSVKGGIFPIKVGNKVSIKIKGKDNLTPQGWVGERKCEVESKEQIEGKFGSHDAFKVVCEDAWFIRTWFYDPELESNVRFDLYDKRKRKSRTLELVRFEKK